MKKNPPPFILRRPEEGPRLPVVMDAPHPGDFLPDDIREKILAPDRLRALLRDSFVDTVIAGAPEHGVTTLINPYDRIFIDLNSRENAIDGPRGLGLIASALMDDDGTLHPIFNKSARPDATAIAQRINIHYRPYYAALSSLMEEAVREHGFALHFNIHSSPRVTFMDKTKIGDIILGNRGNKTCGKDLTRFAMDFFLREGLDTRLNDPFKGGALIEAMGQPENGWHSLQIELSRDIYMNDDNLTPDTAKMIQIQAVMNRFYDALGGFTKEEGSEFRLQI
jgi:N-formylglutamate deformylase